MAGKGRNSASDKAYYSSYNYEAQRRKRLNRHLKKQPNDEQAIEALKNIHHRGPRPSNKKNGWLTRDMMLYGLDEKAQSRVIDIKPETLAWMRGIMRRAKAQQQHEQNYASKEDRKKGGNKRNG